MRVVYVDSDFKCHVTDDGTMTPVETDFFDGKCDNFITGYCLIPEGRSLIRKDGTVIRGLTIFPWKDYRILQAYQEQYEAMSLNVDVIEKAAAYDILMEGVSA